MTTAQVIAQMLKIKTGSALCDSGGTPQYDAEGHYVGSVSGYGRMWERNQDRDFASEAAATLDFRFGSIEYTRNVYHFLVERLDFNETWDGFYQHWLDTNDREYTSYFEDFEDFFKFLKAEGFELASGPYGEGDDSGPLSENSYNGECNLSQTVQFSQFCVNEVPERYEDEVQLRPASLVFLQIHQGADVRGGYTPPRVFTFDLDYDWLSWADGYISCPNCGASWFTDDNYNWYENTPFDPAQDRPEVNLRKCALVNLKDYAETMPEGYRIERVPDEQMVLPGIKAGERLPEPASPLVDWARKCYAADAIFVDEDGNGYCPHCGGLLKPVA